MAFMLILEYVAFEWSYNRDFSKADRIYRVLVTDEETSFNLPPGYGPVMEQQFPGIKTSLRILSNMGDGVFNVETEEKELVFRENNTAYVDPTFIQYFDLNITAGDADLSIPQGALISSSTARKYFGDLNAVGQQITANNQFAPLPYTVTGVYEDIPANSDINYDLLLSVQTLTTSANRDGNDWADPDGLENGFSYIFLELEDPAKVDEVTGQIKDWLTELYPYQTMRIDLQPLEDLHLGDGLNDPLPTYGSRLFVLFLFLVAILIMVIAWVNYINLSTAQALERAKSVGIRKVVGATRLQLIGQYLTETFLLTLISISVAVIMVTLLQSRFNTIVNLPLNFSVFLESYYVWIGTMIVLVGALLSGSYVAFVLTGFKPVQTLAGQFSNSPRGLILRKSLVVLQFAISIAFIAGTVLLFEQLSFLNTQNIGMKIEQRIAIIGAEVKGENYGLQKQSFRDQLKALPYVKNYTETGNLMGKGYNFSQGGVTRLNPKPGDEDINYRMFMIDENYTDTYDMKILAGRSFTTNEAVNGWDTHKVMLNEKALKSLGFNSPEEAVGESIQWYGRKDEVVGVINDYNHQSLRTPIEPTVFLPSRNSGFYTLQMDTEDLQNKLTQIETIYKSAFPGNPFEYEFLDEVFAKLYTAEEQLSRIFTMASLLAIFISVLGLFGLVTFIARQKTKEIGIRKVLGASVGSIVGLLSKEFLGLIVIALMIATPLAWYFMDQWLDNFAYHVNIQWWFFALAGLLTVFIALTAVSFQSIKAALANPVDSLRQE